MRFLLISALAFFPLVAFAATGSETIERYYELRGQCRVGDTVSAQESDAACGELVKLGEQLTKAGYCWFKSEQEWRVCD